MTSQSKLLSIADSLETTVRSLTGTTRRLTPGQKILILSTVGLVSLGIAGAAVTRRFTTTVHRSASNSSLRSLTSTAASASTGNQSTDSVLNGSEEPAPRKKPASTRHRSPAVDVLFLKRMWRILRIILPSWRSKTVMHLSFLTALLVGRSVLSVQVADVMGLIAKSTASVSRDQILLGMAKFVLVAVPGAVLNSGLRYETSMLALRFRERLVRFVHGEYLRHMNFYKASIGGDQRIDNADQRVTQDIDKFCTSMSDLFTNLFKPTLDVILFTYKLSRVVGWLGPSSMYVYFFLSAAILRGIMPSFARLTAEEQKLEGDFRHCHSRLITHAEEVAFYSGGNTEKNIISGVFSFLASHMRNVYRLRFLVGVFDGYIVKYGSAMMGFTILAAPVYFGTRGMDKKTASEISGYYIRNMQLMMNLGKAIGQLVATWRRVTALAGFTARVSELLELVKRLDDPSTSSVFTGPTKALEEANKFPPTIQYGDLIKFEHVSIFTPDWSLLVKDLNFSVKKNQNVLITGPNGSGKSSLFRILGELWPLRCGTLTKPRNIDIFYIPQRPYLVKGSLRAQLLYPVWEMDYLNDPQHNDAHLDEIMNMVNLGYLIDREGGWDTVNDWEEVLSGGEKQRIAMARVFFHRPQYVLLDECTSAVSIDVESKMYEQCALLGITLFTISHRPQLERFHDFALRFKGDGTGRWEWHAIDRFASSKQSRVAAEQQPV